MKSVFRDLDGDGDARLNKSEFRLLLDRCSVSMTDRGR